jgi:hypothetical protein
MSEQPTSPFREADRLIYAGLLGLAAAGVIQLSDKSDLNIAQTVEVYSFALAIPLLTVGLVSDYARRAGTSIPRWLDGFGVLGCIAAVVGLGAVFCHFGIGPGAVFAGGGVLGFILMRRL